MSKSTRKSNQRQEEFEDSTKQKRRGSAPGVTIESRENQIIRLAYDLAEERILKLGAFWLFRQLSDFALKVEAVYVAMFASSYS